MAVVSELQSESTAALWCRMVPRGLLSFSPLKPDRGEALITEQQFLRFWILDFRFVLKTSFFFYLLQFRFGQFSTYFKFGSFTSLTAGEAPNRTT